MAAHHVLRRSKLRLVAKVDNLLKKLSTANAMRGRGGLA